MRAARSTRKSTRSESAGSAERTSSPDNAAQIEWSPRARIGAPNGSSVPISGSLLSVRRVSFGHRVALELGDPRHLPVWRWRNQAGFVVIPGLDDEPCVVNAVLTPEISMCEVVRPGLSEDLEGSLAGHLVRIVRYLDQETVHDPDSLKPSGPYPTPERALILPVLAPG